LAEERFKEIAIAYQTLSDDTLRRKYNEFGPKESAPEGGYVDPEEVFGAIFGGERDMKTALQEAEDAEADGAENNGRPRLKDAKGRDILTPEERAKKEEKERIKAEKDKQKAAEASVLFSLSLLLIV
jgi:DnaJ-class molecular chaperone